jgi:hypothetical protein
MSLDHEERMCPWQIPDFHRGMKIGNAAVLQNPFTILQAREEQAE